MELRVKDICREKNILFKELAERIGISDVALRKQVQGNPSIKTLETIADALGIPFVELFEKPEPSNGITCPHCGKPITIKIEQP